MPIFEQVSPDLPVSLKTNNYTVVADDNGSEIQFEKSTSVTANLPSVDEMANGFNVILRNIGSGTLSVQPAAEQQIDGEGSLSLGVGEWRWIRNDGTEWKSIATSADAGGDVQGPPSSTDNAIARFDGTTGKIIQNSGASIDDSGNISASNLSGTNTGDQTITLTGDVSGSGTGSFPATIANDAVTYAKMQDVSAASKLLGRGSASGAGNVEEITLGTGLAMSGTTLSVNVSSGFTLDTEQAAGSSSTTFSGIPSGTKQIVVTFESVSLSGTDNILIQIGDSGGIENTGYLSQSGNGGTNVNSTSGFIINTSTGGGTISGVITLYLSDVANNTWISGHNFGETTGGINGPAHGGGRKSLSATLDRLIITRSGGNSFTGGAFNIQYI